jgi:hypothetical protein
MTTTSRGSAPIRPPRCVPQPVSEPFPGFPGGRALGLFPASNCLTLGRFGVLTGAGGSREPSRSPSGRVGFARVAGAEDSLYPCRSLGCLVVMESAPASSVVGGCVWLGLDS